MFLDTLVADWAATDSIPMGEDGIITYAIDSSISREDAAFIDRTFEQLEQYLDIDFQKVAPDSGKGKKFVESTAELEFSSQRLIFGDSTIAGYADYQGDGEWDLIMKRDKSYSDEFNQYILLHELGHAMGLEHPFSATDGDSIDTLTGADTVMEYKWVPTDFFQQADIDTMTGMWNDGYFSEAEVAAAPTSESFIEGIFVAEDYMTKGEATRRQNSTKFA